MDFFNELIRDFLFCYVLYKTSQPNQKIYFELMLNQHKIFDIFNDDNFSYSKFMKFENLSLKNTIIYRFGKQLIYINSNDIKFLKKEFINAQYYFYKKHKYLTN